MHPDLNKLICVAKESGELTEKQREIILRKAEKLGEDIDEVEMLLESIRPKQVKTEMATSTEKRMKCPNCGAVVPAYTAICPECHFEILEGKTVLSVESLFDLLQRIDAERPPETLFGKIFKEFGFDSIDSYTRRKQNAIQAFPVPNTKADILEFLSLCVPNAKYLGIRFSRGLNTASSKINAEHNKLVPSWRSKCEQVIIKGYFLLKDDPDTVKTITDYAKELGIALPK